MFWSDLCSVCVFSDGSSDEAMSGLGSPSDPCLSPLAWSVTGKYLASAMEKMVNIWQVNGTHLFIQLLWVLHSVFTLLYSVLMMSSIWVVWTKCVSVNCVMLPSVRRCCVRSTECEWEGIKILWFPLKINLPGDWMPSNHCFLPPARPAACTICPRPLSIASRIKVHDHVPVSFHEHVSVSCGWNVTVSLLHKQIKPVLCIIIILWVLLCDKFQLQSMFVPLSKL